MSANEIPQTQLVKVDEIKLVALKEPVSFETIKQQITDAVSKYDLVVTQENYKDIKPIATELNAMKNLINQVKKEEVDIASIDINNYKEQMKTLAEIPESMRVKLLERIAVFEDEIKAKALELLNEELISQYEEKQIREEFRIVDISDGAKLTSLTATMKLTKGAKDTVSQRVDQKLALQNRTDMRIMQLENECFKNGLQIPLTKEHILGFLYEKDEIYNENLSKLIASEIERNAKIAEHERQKAEVKVREEIKQEQLQNTTPFEEEAKEPVKEEVPVATDGKVEKTLSIKIRVPESASDAQIIGAVINMIKADKFPLENIEVN